MATFFPLSFISSMQSDQMITTRDVTMKYRCCIDVAHKQMVYLTTDQLFQWKRLMNSWAQQIRGEETSHVTTAPSSTTCCCLKGSTLSGTATAMANNMVNMWLYINLTPSFVTVGKKALIYSITLKICQDNGQQQNQIFKKLIIN